MDEKVEQLYDALFVPYPEFCKSLAWLVDGIAGDEATNRFEQMWGIYLAVMARVGQKLFGRDLCWNPHSEQVGPALDLLLNEGYSEIIIQLILGANNLFVQTKSEGYEYKASKLREIANQYYAIIKRYKDGGVLTTEDRMIKWNFIDHSNRLFGAAFDIVEAASKPIPIEKSNAKKHQKTVGEVWDDLFEELDHPIRYKMKKIWEKIISRIKK